MTGAIDCDDAQAEGDRAQRSALPVEGVTGRQGVRETTPTPTSVLRSVSVTSRVARDYAFNFSRFAAKR
jgi:hypothetical protein